MVSSAELFNANYDPAASAEALFAMHVRWGQDHEEPHRFTHENVPDPSRILRVGYVSPDFRENAVMVFMAPVLAHHDPAEVRVFLYGSVRRPDATTARIRTSSPAFRDISRLSDGAAAERIHADEIDVLVDLAGHLGEGRLPIFAQRPAPVQVTYMGYPNTTGLRAIDYRLTDAVADPPGEPSYHVEELFRLPRGFSCYAPPVEAPSVSPSPALARGWVTFGSKHKIEKLNPSVVSLWARVLHEVPRSRILLYRHRLDGEIREQVVQRFAAHGIAADRIDLRNRMPDGRHHLAVYEEIDVSLDAFPWTGPTTACDALWMGAPVVTWSGARHAERMVASILASAGLGECVARSPDEYVAIAARLAADVDALAELRRGLRARVAASPLCDGPSFTRDLEAAYRAMWQRWCATHLGAALIRA
jgi:predicted O-linked N-acetylglucosamine transferase (SPINDLY family)